MIKMCNILTLSLTEYNVLKKFTPTIENRFKCKINVPEIDSSDCCSSNDVIVINIVGEKDTVNCVKRFLKSQLKPKKTERSRKRKRKIPFICLDSDSEVELENMNKSRQEKNYQDLLLTYTKASLTEKKEKWLKRRKRNASVICLDSNSDAEYGINALPKYQTDKSMQGETDTEILVTNSDASLTDNLLSTTNKLKRQRSKRRKRNIPVICLDSESDNELGINMLSKCEANMSMQDKIGRETLVANSHASFTDFLRIEKLAFTEDFIPLRSREKKNCSKKKKAKRKKNSSSKTLEKENKTATSALSLSTCNTELLSVKEPSVVPSTHSTPTTVDQSNTTVGQKNTNVDKRNTSFDQSNIASNHSITPSCDNKIASNVESSIPVSLTPRRLRPIVIDGSNIARAHGQPTNTFSGKGIQLCIEYFLKRGHTLVTALIPRHRMQYNKKPIITTDQKLLQNLERIQRVVLTPSRRIGKKLCVSYDDRFIVELAVRTGGIIVSNDNFRDLLDVSPDFKEAIEQRLLMFCFVGDVFMIPNDPLGRRGPTLETFLSFPPSTG